MHEIRNESQNVQKQDKDNSTELDDEKLKLKPPKERAQDEFQDHPSSSSSSLPTDENENAKELPNSSPDDDENKNISALQKGKEFTVSTQNSKSMNSSLTQETKVFKSFHFSHFVLKSIVP